MPFSGGGHGVEWLDGLALLDLLQSGDISATDLVRSTIRRIERLNPAINAIVAPTFERALDESASPTLAHRPFRGLPFLLKDIGATQAGLPQYSGSRALKAQDSHSVSDTVMGARFRQAGFVVVGTTNTSEFGAQPTTQPLAFGATRNPWALDHSVAGSSGGAAAAVASGIVPIAHGTDIAGSIRMPSAWCGVVGLKPSRGRVPVGPVIARDLVEHVITRSVRDTAAVLDAIIGPELGELYAAPPPARPYRDEVGARPGHLRIGALWAVDASVAHVHPECVAAVRSCAELLESLGHTVELAGPPGLFDDAFVANWTAITAVRLNRLLETVAAGLGRSLTTADVEPYQLALAGQGVTSATAYLALLEWQQLYASRIAAWWSDFDVLVTPTTGEPPAELDSLVPPPGRPLSLLPRFLQIQCFAIPFSVTGQPAISLPLHWTAEGLPAGVQLVARHGEEHVLLRLAGQLEEARPWDRRRPSAIVDVL